MLRNIKYLASLLLFWIVFFFAGKLLFVIVEWHITSQVSIADISKALFIGLKMDISTSCYVGMLVCISSLSLLFRDFLFRKIVAVINCLLIFIFSFVLVSDFELYKNWLQHIDVSVFQFFDSSFSFLSSTSNVSLLLWFVVWLLFCSSFIYLYFRFIANILEEKIPKRWFNSLILLLLGAVLFIPARGGIDVASMNTGSVYFSQNMTANHIAVNPIWNFLYSFNRMSSLNNPYIYMDSKDAKDLFDKFQEKHDSTEMILNTDKPNIIFVLMESFESDLTKTLGGRNGITPNFDSLTHEGVLFSNMIASGTRTDKGFVSVLCGYPAQSVNPIIKFTRKIEKLPTISKQLARENYSTLFVYGGNKQFTNMNSLIMAGGFSDVTDMTDFDKSLHTFKWGVHDEYVYSRSIEKMNAGKKPFFCFVMSLSNHEPFDVPTKKQFKEVQGDEAKFYNSAFYADSCLAVFIRNAKKQKWWKNTLIVLVADHASIAPGNKTNENINRYRIPMLWLGGALRMRDTIITKYCSQMDIAKTIMHQLKLNDSLFVFSKNILNKYNKGNALFCYNDGFGLISDLYFQLYDNQTKRYVVNKGNLQGKDTLIGKAFWQVVNDDFVRK